MNLAQLYPSHAVILVESRANWEAKIQPTLAYKDTGSVEEYFMGKWGLASVVPTAAPSGRASDGRKCRMVIVLRVLGGCTE